MSVFIGYPSFMAYQMMKGKKGNNDGFPSIPGMIARYSALGLTNEQMAANPVWVDKTGNGHDLQLKNFSWKGMSGVGGYVGDFSKWVNNRDTTEIGITKSNSKVIIDVKVSQGSGKNIVFISKSNLGISNNVTIKITSTYPEGVMKFANSASNKYLKLPSNGIITLQDNPEYTSNEMHLHLASADLGQITIEQLPLYPGFILGDGVDDFAVTEKELNFEDTYTVYTAFIPFQNNPTRNMIVCGADSKKTFSMQYSSLVYVSFIAGNNYYINADFVNGLNLFACKRNGNNMCIKNLLTNKVVTGTCGDWVENAGLYFLWKNAIYASFARAAIAGQTICNGYYSTDEDDEKVLNWYKKQYPWLFPDQAWTVTGKTNEDEDRATIANITGNGNNLILSNFGFIEGSGYGLYKTPFELYPSVQHSSKYSLSFSKFALGDHNLIIAPKQNDLSYDIKVKVTGLKDGVKFKWGWIGTTGYIDITTDGIHMLNKPASQIRQLIVEFAEDFDPDHVVTIEQIPEYEGYLVTDGVDDIASSNTVVYEADFTFIGEWKFIQKDDTVAGINSSSHLYIQNRYNRGATVMINSAFENKKNITDYMTFKAITSKGKGYDENWNEADLLYGDGSKGTSGVNIGGQGGTEFCHMIFKNMALYMNKVFTKDDCIKAYNYLQTLKAK